MQNNSPSLVVPYIISITVHLIFFAWVVLKPATMPDMPFERDQVIDVSMVTMNEAAGPAPVAKQAGENKSTAAPKPEPPQKADDEPTPEDAVPIPSEPEPPPEEAAPVEPVKPKVKTSLKKKTFKPKKVKKPVQKVAQKKEPPKANPVSDALKRLQQKVQQDEKSGRYNASESSFAGQQTGGQGSGGATGRRRRELIDQYRVEISLLVQKNWAFSEQLAGQDQNLMASLVFKVMPNGEVRDIFYIDRSGNQYLDDSAYKAVVKTNPVPPHPKGLIESFVDVGLRFTPKGVQ